MYKLKIRIFFPLNTVVWNWGSSEEEIVFCTNQKENDCRNVWKKILYRFALAATKDQLGLPNWIKQKCCGSKGMKKLRKWEDENVRVSHHPYYQASHLLVFSFSHLLVFSISHLLNFSSSHVHFISPVFPLNLVSDQLAKNRKGCPLTAFSPV